MPTYENKNPAPPAETKSDAAGNKNVKIYYFDATAGDDGNSGLSLNYPKKTITAANALTLLPGETVAFKAGETFAGKLVITAAGTAASRITFTRYGTGANPKINGATQTSAIEVTTDGSHLDIDGIDAYGSTDHVILLYDTNIHDIKVRNLVAYNGATSGIYVGVPDVTVSNVTVHDNGTSQLHHGIYVGAGRAGNSTSTNFLIENVISYNNKGFGVTSWYSGGGVIKNVTAYGNGTSAQVSGGICIGSLAAGLTVTAHHNTLYNNVSYGVYVQGTAAGATINLYHNTDYGEVAGLADAGTHSGTVTAKNNIWSANSALAMSAASPVTNDYTLYYKTGDLLSWATVTYTVAQWAVYKAASSQDAHSPTPGDPLFTNVGTGDFTISVSSPAYQTGVYIAGISTSATPNIGSK
jgi:hypothetical protein